MTKQLSPPDSAEVRAADDARRTSSYRLSVWSEESERRLEDEHYAHQYLENLGRYRREQDVIVAEIVAAGRNPTPPAGWRPSPPGNGTPGPAAR
jgi:hypothetical protein